ncbi:MBL fold metallo-hydrolase [Oscillospiraceae bacterium 38-13]
MLLLDFINVGYGDSILVQEIQGGKTVYTLLMDCGDTEEAAGYERQRIRTCDYLKKTGVRQIDTLLLTHLHKDHIGGLPQIAEVCPIQRIVSGYYPPRSARSPWTRVDGYQGGARALAEAAGIYLDALRGMERFGTRRQLLQNASETLRLTDSLSLDCVQGWKDFTIWQEQILDALYQDIIPPAEGDINWLDGCINNLSIVSLLRYKGKRVLLPGDAGLSFWKEHPLPESCDIVKLPHHGHRDAFNAELFQKTDPKYVVVSVSNERTDDCPSAGLPQMLEGRTLLFTDAVVLPHSGDSPSRTAVRFTVDGTGRLHPPALL